MKNANDSSKLQFRILTTEEDAPQLLKKVKERPGCFGSEVVWMRD